VTEETIDEILGDLIGRTWKLSQAADYKDDVEGDRLEPALDRIGYAEIEVEGRYAGRGGGALIE
jgi:hypothetical protein